jgi:hypothetical protein
MARATELPIYREAYELLLKVTAFTQNYPRGYRQGLAPETEVKPLRLRELR